MALGLACSALVCPAWVLAQTATPSRVTATPADPTVKDTQQDGRQSEQRVEQIRHEDAGSRIDELRVGGETRTITVQPKNGGAPAYEITPPSNNVNPANSDHNSQGGSRWKVLSY